MEKIFLVWFRIFSEKKYLSKSKNMRIAFYSAKHLIIYLQHVQFFWYYDIEISQFSSYVGLWKTLSLASFDVIAANYGFLRNYTVFITAFLSGSLFLIILAVVLESINKKIPTKIFPLLRFLLILNCDVFFIPSVLVLQLAFKYSSVGLSQITEYSTKISNEEMDFGQSARASFILILILFLFFTAIYETSCYEMRQNTEDLIHDNKIYCIIDFIKKTVDFLTTCLFLYFGRKNYEIYLVILLLCHSLTTFYYLYSIPYYCYFLNYLKLVSGTSLTFVSVFFLVGYKMDNSSVTMVLFASSNLLLIPLCKATLDKRYQLIEKPQNSIYLQFGHFEKSIREYLRTGSLAERLQVKMNKNNRIHKSVLNKLCQAYYCNDILGNCALAQNNVFQIRESGINLLLNYQIFKCRLIMQTACEQTSQSYKLFKYFLEFSEIKKSDRNFCQCYNNLITTLSENSTQIRDLKALIIEMVEKLYGLEKGYTSLLMRFPNSAEIKQIYGTFLLNILNDSQRGNKLIAKSSTVKANRNNTRNLLKFISDRCFLVVSGDYNSLGKVLFFNQNFLNFLGYTNQTIKGVSLNQLIPKEYTKKHDSHVLRFLENSVTNIVFKNLVLSLVDSEGYLCECIINCECIGYGHAINFILAIDPLNFRRREIALVNSEGLIFGHSKGFSNILGCGLRYIESRYIQEFVQTLNMNDLKPNKVNYFPIMNTQDRFHLTREFAFVLKVTKVRKTSILFIYVSEDKNEIRSWENDLEFYDVDELNNYGNKIETVITEGFEEFKEVNIKKKVKIFGQESDEDLEENFFNKQLINNSMSPQSSQYLTENNLKAISKSRLMLKVIKWLTVISVIFMKLIGIITSNVGILIYLTHFFNESNSITHFSILGEFSYLCVKSSVVLRSLDISNVLKIEKQFDESELKYLILRFKGIKSQFFKEKDYFDSCEYTNSVNHKSFNYWSIEQTAVKRKASLIEFTELFRLNVKNK